MKKSIVNLLLTLIFVPCVGYGQTTIITEGSSVPKRFKHGDMFYASDFRGLKYFMADLERDNPVLFGVMQPEFSSILQKRTNAVITWSASSVVSTTLIIGGFTFLQADDNFYKPGEPFYKPGAKKPSAAAIFSGLGVLVAGGVIGLIIYPNEHDIYQFINQFNRNSPDKRLDWEIGLHVFPNKEPGLKLTMNL